MATYLVGNKILEADDPVFADTLASIYNDKVRPLCRCRNPGLEMYIARVQGKYIIKRMPNTGSDHAPACDSYEPPPELSGLGQVIGTAIQESPDESITTLKLDFSLSKGAGRSAPVSSGVESDSVKTDGNKLTLRSVLHYLWEEAGFNHWSPAMNGKRSWYVIRKYLLQASRDKVAKGSSLSEILYVPEPFAAEKKAEIAQRRVALTSKAAAPLGGARRLMLVVGVVKEISKARYGHKVILKHSPDWHFMMNDDIYNRLLKRFSAELELWAAFLPNAHLIMIGTFGIGTAGLPSLEEVALMVVTDNWIPFESAFDKTVLDALTQADRRFVKGMRYNLPSTRPLACAVASDTTPLPTAMYILPPGSTEDYADAMSAMVGASGLASWVWSAGADQMPPLPALLPL